MEARLIFVEQYLKLVFLCVFCLFCEASQFWVICYWLVHHLKLQPIVIYIRYTFKYLKYPQFLRRLVPYALLKTKPDIYSFLYISYFLARIIYFCRFLQFFIFHNLVQSHGQWKPDLFKEKYIFGDCIYTQIYFFPIPAYRHMYDYMLYIFYNIYYI